MYQTLQIYESKNNEERNEMNVILNFIEENHTRITERKSLFKAYQRKNSI
jgi:hypothetical protein